MRDYHLTAASTVDLVGPNILYSGKVSWFGGPDDMGVTKSEGLALFDWPDISQDDYKWLFLPPDKRKAGFGLARSLNPSAWYCAMRWNYDSYPREKLRREGIVEVSFGGKTIWCTPADWGPNVRTGRIIDISPGALFQLGCKTDDVVTVKLLFGKRATLVG